ncbi:hypothetical protein RDI58_013527 [Solanum bulbocastanum]|uniref:Uncharacterized protein n=1 Tax=Solanum bulbocastanum TaxID=147425 RepID=A0AAN8TR34_SOLBU
MFNITNEYKDKLRYVGVQQLIVYVPTEKYYEIEVVEDSELDVDVENIIRMKESMVVIDEVATDCTSVDGTNNDIDIFTDNSEELEVLVQEKKRIIDCNLCDYKDLHRWKKKYLRMYICFEAIKNGFKNGLRPFTVLDGTFFMGKAKCLRYVQLELIEDVKDVLHNVMHKYCVRHIEANWRKKGMKSKLMSKMDKQCDNGKKQKKERHKTLIDEEDVEHSPTRSPNATTMEGFPLTSLQPSQDFY